MYNRRIIESYIQIREFSLSWYATTLFVTIVARSTAFAEHFATLSRRNIFHVLRRPSETPTETELTTSQLASLPAELIANIGERLEWQDVKACRATGNFHLANSLSFRCGLIAPSVMLADRASCKTCAWMLHREDFARRVKKLYINMEEASEAALDLRMLPEAFECREDQRAAEREFREYENVLGGQRYWRENHPYDIMALADTFRQLKAVSNAVEIVLTSNANCYRHWHCSSRRHESQGFEVDEGLRSCERKFCPCASGEVRRGRCDNCDELRPFGYARLSDKLGRPLNAINNPCEDYKNRVPDKHVIDVVFRALAVSEYRPSGLRAENASHNIPFAVFALPSPLYGKLADSVANLRSLHLRLEGPGSVRSTRSRWSCDERLPNAFAPGVAGLAGLLARASCSLETLALSHFADEGSDLDTDTTYACTFKHCIQANTFPKLRWLALGVSAFTCDDIREFVGRHVATLRRVSLVQCKIMDVADFDGLVEVKSQGWTTSWC